MIKAHFLMNERTTKGTLPMSESPLERRQTRRKLTAGMLAEIGESLSDIDWRLLHWLLRYPLQRADDLVVGIARWASRATVYRHVQALEARGLVESALPKTPGAGKRLYYLSNPGLHLLARHLDRPARELARRWQADEVGLLRLLPRLPTLLVLQDVVNGLVTYAAEAMTTQGRRPLLVRWNWQREVTYRFQYREQSMRFFADGAVALCVRTPQSESSVLDQWFGLFLLSTDLDDARLMRLRIERLLCWRESPERWSTYQHMLPVLILARSQRQRDHWQRAVEATSLKLRLGPLAGALACFPQSESTYANPWLLNWRTLATDVSCHLHDLLKPLPPAAFPPSLWLEEGEDEEPNSRSPSSASAATVSSGTLTRLSRLMVGNLAERAAQVAQDELEDREVIALLGLRLTPCQWNILRLLLAHPLLSDEELADFLDIQWRSVRCSLYELHQLRCLEPIATEVGKRWHLCERGLRLVAAVNHIHIRNIAALSDDGAESETSTVVQRGEAWLLQRIGHTAGIYSFFARLAQASKREPEQALGWWETGVVCERRYRVGEQWYNLRPDALAEYRIGQQQMRFWLEWDRGTMNVRDLAVKLTSYAHYIASREWAREHLMLPVLICVAPDIAQEKRMQRIAQDRLTRSPGVVLLTTTAVLLKDHGPLAPIWLHGIPQSSQVAQSGSSLRQCLFDVIPGKKGR
jgi:predicted transcriptional regulator